MPPCLSLSFTAYRDRCFNRQFSSLGLRHVTTYLPGDTVVSCWAPPQPANPDLPSLLLLHGFGANATWQWGPYLKGFVDDGFNVYVPDLLFFGGSFTAQPDRSESFQATSMMKAMEAIGAPHFVAVVGVSYGGIVAYKIAEMYPNAVDRVVLICAGICIEEHDLESGLFVVSDLAEAASLLLPQTPEKLRELVRLTHYVKRLGGVPSCFLADYIHVMCTDYVQEKTELINALIKDKKLSDLPKFSQPTLIIWGEYDQVFPLELAYRLKRHLEENSELVVIKKAGHAVNLEKPKEVLYHLQTFLVDFTTKGYHKRKETSWSFSSRNFRDSVKKITSTLPLLPRNKEEI